MADYRYWVSGEGGEGYWVETPQQPIYTPVVEQYKLSGKVGMGSAGPVVTPTPDTTAAMTVINAGPYGSSPVVVQTKRQSGSGVTGWQTTVKQPYAPAPAGIAPVPAGGPSFWEKAASVAGAVVDPLLPGDQKAEPGENVLEWGLDQILPGDQDQLSDAPVLGGLLPEGKLNLQLPQLPGIDPQLLIILLLMEE